MYIYIYICIYIYVYIMHIHIHSVEPRVIGGVEIIGGWAL